MTILEHAEQVLKNADRLLTAREVVKGYVPPKGGKTPTRSFSSAVSAGNGKIAIKRIGTNQFCLKNKIEDIKTNEIRLLAYSKWEQAGKPMGDGKAFWIEAEKEINAKWNV